MGYHVYIVDFQKEFFKGRFAAIKGQYAYIFL